MCVGQYNGLVSHMANTLFVLTDYSETINMLLVLTDCSETIDS